MIILMMLLKSSKYDPIFTGVIIFERQDDLSQYHPDDVVSFHVRCFITLMMLTSFLCQGDIYFSAYLHHDISEGGGDIFIFEYHLDVCLFQHHDDADIKEISACRLRALSNGGDHFKYQSHIHISPRSYSGATVQHDICASG